MITISVGSALTLLVVQHRNSRRFLSCHTRILRSQDKDWWLEIENQGDNRLSWGL